MKTCSYCGRENDIEVTRCIECGTEGFSAKAAATPDAPPVILDSGKAIKITASSALVSCYLKIDANGIAYCESVIGNRERRFRYDEISLVLLSPENLLSIQVGQEIFKLPIKPNDSKHQEGLQRLIAGTTSSLHASTFSYGQPST